MQLHDLQSIQVPLFRGRWPTMTGCRALLSDTRSSEANAYVRSGDLWSVPLSDGRFACLRILSVPASGRYERQSQRSRSSTGPAMRSQRPSRWPAPRSNTSARCTSARSRPAAAPSSATGPFSWMGLRSRKGSTPSGATSTRKRRTELLFVQGEPPPDSEMREVSSPLTDEMLRPIKAPSATVQFSRMLTDAEFIVLSEWLAPQPNVTLRFYGAYDGATTSLHSYASSRRCGASPPTRSTTRCCRSTDCATWATSSNR